MSAEYYLTAEMHVAEAGRRILAAELAVIREHSPALHQGADVIAVHETRKAIRRTLTAMRLFPQFFEPEAFTYYRRRLRKMMRKLESCRDAAVFLFKLAQYAESDKPLPELEAYWRERKAAADASLGLYLDKPMWQIFLTTYADFTCLTGQSVKQPGERIAPVRTAHWIPLLIYERLAHVLAYGEYLATASLETLHHLRIRFKDLRYTLIFFAALLTANVADLESTLEALQDLMGDLNDAKVAVQMLDETPDRIGAVSHYRQVQEVEIGRLRSELPGLWATFDSVVWRRKLALSVAQL